MRIANPIGRARFEFGEEELGKGSSMKRWRWCGQGRDGGGKNDLVPSQLQIACN